MQKVTIVPRGQALGVTWQAPPDDRHNYAEADLRARIAGALGGRAAEALALGTPSTGAENDLQQATALARQMVTRWGMSPRVGPVYAAREDGGFLGQAGDMPDLGSGVSDELAAIVDEETRRIIDECYAAGGGHPAPGALAPGGPGHGPAGAGVPGRGGDPPGHRPPGTGQGGLGRRRVRGGRGHRGGNRRGRGGNRRGRGGRGGGDPHRGRRRVRQSRRGDRLSRWRGRPARRTLCRGRPPLGAAARGPQGRPVHSCEGTRDHLRGAPPGSERAPRNAVVHEWRPGRHPPGPGFSGVVARALRPPGGGPQRRRPRNACSSGDPPPHWSPRIRVLFGPPPGPRRRCPRIPVALAGRPR